MSFGEKLKYAREHIGLSKSELAIKAGITQPYITALESGKRKEPSFAKVQAIAKGLGVSLDYFVNDKFKPTVIEEVLPLDLQEYVKNSKNIPMLRIIKRASELNIPAEMLKIYIETLSKFIK